MPRFIIFISILIVAISCQNTPKKNNIPELNLELSKEIDMMANRDQQMQLNILKFMNAEESEMLRVDTIRDQVYEKHAKRIKEIINQYGYPGYDIVGRKSTENFSVLVSHSRDFPKLKESALIKMKEKISSSNVSRERYVSMMDEFAKENKKPSVYGTFLSYTEKGELFLEGDYDMDIINKNRIDLGLDSFHIFMNKKFRTNQ